ncbi:hypothetical protein VKT23_004964 [Stygiomarasmius scandens]|uniref:Phosphoglycerate mutase-like protein n=1 Tax=Marasmiellus scandens TaxID=2682957 RepID=A0ABR1JSA6_9AGAR
MITSKLLLFAFYLSASGYGILADPLASSFAGSTSTFQFPPEGVSASSDSNFPDAQDVGFAGPTPTGDEANSIATAPAVAQVDSVFPLVESQASDSAPINGSSTSFDIFQHWGSLSPFKSVDSLGVPGSSARIPDGCSLQQVHLLHRHGARYPASSELPASFAAALHAAATNSTGFNASGPLEFLNTWTYKLGAEILTPFGRSELFNLGIGFRVKYGELLKGFTNLPVFRTTSQERMVDSALHFSAGFFGVQSYQSSYRQLIEIESSGFNNTLAPYEICPNANNDIGNFGFMLGLQWAPRYLAKAQERLGAYIQGFELGPTELVSMQQLCAYETVSLGYSAFCDLFTEEEWKGFAYAADLVFWYSLGPGSPFSAALGKGWVEEMISRLEKNRITNSSSAINQTITSNNITFPLDQPIYVDATHDSVLSSIFTTLNFTSFAASGPLPTDHIPDNLSYNVNKFVPFGANLVGQVLSCPASEEPTHIRWVLNDAVVPLTGIKGCTEDSNGLCELDTFISSMKERLGTIDFDFDCFANYTIPNPDEIIDGRFPK